MLLQAPQLRLRFAGDDRRAIVEDEIDDPANRLVHRYLRTCAPTGVQDVQQRLEHGELQVVADQRACPRVQPQPKVAAEGRGQASGGLKARLGLASLDRVEGALGDATEARQPGEAEAGILTGRAQLAPSRDLRSRARRAAVRSMFVRGLGCGPGLMRAR